MKSINRFVTYMSRVPLQDWVGGAIIVLFVINLLLL